MVGSVVGSVVSLTHYCYGTVCVYSELRGVSGGFSGCVYGQRCVLCV